MGVEQPKDDVIMADINADNPAVSKKTDIPIDKGWAWVVLVGCLIEITIYGGVMRSFGVFFIEFQERFQASASATALMSLIQNVSLSLTSICVMTIGLQKFSSRVSVFFGGFLTVTGFLITAFTTNLLVYYFAQGLLCGVGMAFIHAPELAIIGAYFHKHRAVANGIFTSGMSVGGLIFAPVVVKLFDTYRYTGAMLIMSAMFMHIFVGSLLLRPIDFYTKDKHDLTNYDKPETCETVQDDVECKETLLDNRKVDGETSRPHASGNADINMQCLSKTANDDLNNVEYEVDHTDKEIVVEYSRNLDTEVHCSTYTEYVKDTNLINKNKTGGNFNYIVKSIFDVQLLKNPCFIMLLMLTFTLMTGHTVVVSFIPAHAKQMGISNYHIGILLSISATVDLFARISVGILVDRHLMRWSTILAISGCVLGTCCHLLRYASTFTSTVVLVITIGLCCGQYHSLFAVVFMDVIGIEKFKSSLGFGTLIQGSSTATFIPLVGYLRDVTGSYIASYHMLGTLAYISVILVLVIPIVKRRRDEKHTKCI